MPAESPSLLSGAPGRPPASGNPDKRFSKVVSLEHADECLRGRFQALDDMLPVTNASAVDQRGYLREEGSIECWCELCVDEAPDQQASPEDRQHRLRHRIRLGGSANVLEVDIDPVGACSRERL